MKIVFFLCGNLLFLKMRNKNKKEEKVESAAAFRRRGDPTEKNFFLNLKIPNKFHSTQIVMTVRH